MSSHVSPAEKPPINNSPGIGVDVDVVQTSVNDKSSVEEKHVEDIKDSSFNDMEYTNDNEEPELHARTWVALAAMFVLNMVQVVALQGPPAMVRLGADLNDSEVEKGEKMTKRKSFLPLKSYQIYY